MAQVSTSLPLLGNFNTASTTPGIAGLCRTASGVTYRGLLWGATTLADSTLDRYAHALARFDAYLKLYWLIRLDDLCTSNFDVLFARVASYLETAYRLEWFRRSSAGTLISALRQVMLRLVSIAVAPVSCLAGFQLLWKQLTRWKRADPGTFRTPVPQQVLLAVLLWSEDEAALLLGLSFHCLLRPGEATNLRWCDVVSIADSVLFSSPLGSSDAFGVVCLQSPKSAAFGQARSQFVIIHSAKLVSAWARLRDRRQLQSDSTSKVFPSGVSGLNVLWIAALKACGLAGNEYTLGGLRAGGATSYYFQTLNPGSLRWRGRWRHEVTMEHYLQEAMVQLSWTSLDAEARSRISSLAVLAGELVDNICRDWVRRKNSL